MIWALSIIGALAVMAGLLLMVFSGGAGSVVGVLLWILAVLLAIYWELHKMGRSLKGTDDKREP